MNWYIKTILTYIFINIMMKFDRCVKKCNVLQKMCKTLSLRGRAGVEILENFFYYIK